MFVSPMFGAAALTENEPPRLAVAAWIVAPLAAVKLALHLFVLAVTTFGVHRDEFLYMSMGLHLRFWRMDFPPAIAVLANLSRALFDHTLAAVRVFPAIEGTILLVLAALVARELGGGAFAQGLAALSVLCGLVFQRSATLFQPVVLDQIWWTLALFALARIARDPSPRHWIGFGVALGCGLFTKFSILFFVLGALLAILATPLRRSLWRPWPWLGAAIALVIGSPSIAGQLALGFPIVDQMKDLQGEQLAHVSFWSFITTQPLMLAPIAFLIALVGAGGLVAWRPLRRFAVVGWACVFSFAILLLLHGKPYYIGPIYPTLFGAGGVVLERLRPTRTVIAARWLAVVGVLAFGALLLPIGVPLLSRENTAAWALRVGAAPALRTNRGVMDRLPQDFADMIGWPEQAHLLSLVYHTLSPEERREAVIFASNYGEAGAAEFYGPSLGLPPVVSAAGSFWFFGPGERPGRVLITIGEDSADVAKAYDDVRPAGRIMSPWSVGEERDVPLMIGRAPKQSLQRLWPSLRGRN
jgi:hypothetical protein